MKANYLSWASRSNFFDLLQSLLSPQQTADNETIRTASGEPESLGEYAYFELVEVPALWSLKQYP